LTVINKKVLRRLYHASINPDRAIRWVFGGQKGKENVIFSYISDYKKDLNTIKKASSFLNADLTKYYDELISDNQYKKLEREIAGNPDTLWLFGFNEAKLLYTLTRFFKPQIIIETGVASGLSSFMFLLALEKNSKGHLYSIDFHTETPERKKTGWLVHDNLKERWNLELGDSKKILPIILDKLKKCDIFFHDSNHSYEHMTWECETVWPYLKTALLCDDINQNKAFDDFSKKPNRKGFKISNRNGIILPV